MDTASMPVDRQAELSAGLSVWRAHAERVQTALERAQRDGEPVEDLDRLAGSLAFAQGKVAALEQALEVGTP